MQDVTSLPQKAGPEKIFFPNLDGLRFIAFFLVFLQHSLGGEISIDPTLGFLPRFLWLSLRAGGIGVSFFFVLSGFLITYLILREIALKGKLDVISFYIRRALRIWPLYYVVITFGFLSLPFIKTIIGGLPNTEIGNPLYYYAFLSNFDLIKAGGNGMVSINIAWSIAVEEQFYLLWPLLFFFTKPKHYLFIFTAILALSAWFRITHATEQYVLYFHTFSAISDMALGGMMAYLSLTSDKLTDYFARMSKLAIGSAYLAGIIWLMYQEVWLPKNSLASAVFSRLVAALFFAFIILEQNYATRSLVKMKNFALVSRMGQYTYGLYLLHPIAILGIVAAKQMLHINSTSFLISFFGGLASLALSLLLSITSYHLFEQRFLRLKERFSYLTTNLLGQPN